MRVFNQPAYVLIARPYSETSSIVEVFTRDHGRLGLIAKGAKRLKSKIKGVLQPFQPLLVSWTGKGEVPTLTAAEIDLSRIDLFDFELKGGRLVCGFYCNELLVRSIHRYDPHSRLFDVYNETVLELNNVKSKKSLADLLRFFEQSLIKEAGYAVDFLMESDGSSLIEDDAFYRFQSGKGFVKVNQASLNSYQGRVIKSLHGSNYLATELELIGPAKQLMREVLSQSVGYKEITSRHLFLTRQGLE